MRTIGVVPCAGHGWRWGGFMKELLPVGERTHLIDRTMQAMQKGGADLVVVVVSPFKTPGLVLHLQRHAIPIVYKVQKGDNDIYSAIEETFSLQADRYLFGMPDTHYPVEAFEREWRAEFELGVFDTTQPERYGVIQDGQVINKQKLSGERFRAWGVLSWTADVVALWQAKRPKDYTDAINFAIEAYGLHTWPLAHYTDMARFEDYSAWIRGNT